MPSRCKLYNFVYHVGTFNSTKLMLDKKKKIKLEFIKYVSIKHFEYINGRHCKIYRCEAPKITTQAFKSHRSKHNSYFAKGQASSKCNLIFPKQRNVINLLI